MSSFMDCWSVPLCLETNTIEFYYGSQALLDEGSVVEIEFKVWSVLWIGISSVITLDCYNSHRCQDLCNAIT